MVITQRASILTALATTVVTASLLASCSQEARRNGAVSHGTIVRVVDGDTLIVHIGNRDESVRLIGINTPETVAPHRPVECFGPEASAFTKSFLPRGTRVNIVRDVEARDKYDRLLLYVYRSVDGSFVNLELVARGYARPYPFEPNTAMESLFASAAREASEAGLGLWGACKR